MCRYFQENGNLPVCTHDCNGCMWHEESDRMNKITFEFTPKELETSEMSLADAERQNLLYIRMSSVGAEMELNEKMSHMVRYISGK